MSKQQRTLARRPTPSAGSGMLITILERYVKQVPNRTRRELALARAIDAHEGARAKIEDAVKRWQALPLEKRITTVGRSYATLDTNTKIEEDEFAKQFKLAFTPDLVEVAPGISVRRRTAQEFQIGSKPFTLPNIEINQEQEKIVRKRAGTKDIVKDAIKKPGLIIGNPPEVHTMSAGLPLYQVEFAGVYCQKETSWDMGSPHDEMYSLFSMFLDPKLNMWSKRSALYDTMDSGDDWREDPSPCILYGPGPAPGEGTLTINTLMCEYDYGNPDEINKLWHETATVATCVAKAYGYDVKPEVANAAANLLNTIFGLGDDMMSSDTIILDPSGFEWWANQPLNHFKVQLNYHFFTFHTNNDAKYYSFYRVRRL